MGPSVDSVQLVYSCGWVLWFMADIIIVNGPGDYFMVCKSSYNWGGPILYFFEEKSLGPMGPHGLRPGIGVNLVSGHNRKKLSHAQFQQEPKMTRWWNSTWLRRRKKADHIEVLDPRFFFGKGPAPIESAGAFCPVLGPCWVMVGSWSRSWSIMAIPRRPSSWSTCWTGRTSSLDAGGGEMPLMRFGIRKHVIKCQWMSHVEACFECLLRKMPFFGWVIIGLHISPPLDEWTCLDSPY